MALVKLEKMKTTVNVHEGVDLMYWKTRKCKQGARQPFGVVLAVAGYDRRAYFAEELEREACFQELEEKLGQALEPTGPERAQDSPSLAELRHHFQAEEVRQELDFCGLCAGEPGKAPAVVQLEHVDVPVCSECQEARRSPSGGWDSGAWQELEEVQREFLKREEEGSN